MVWEPDGCGPMRGCHNDETSKEQANRFIYFFLADCNSIWNCPADLGIYRKLLIKRMRLEEKELHSLYPILSQTSQMIKGCTCDACVHICVRVDVGKGFASPVFHTD